MAKNEDRHRHFKCRRGLLSKGMSYDKQGLIYFTCKGYFTVLSKEEKERFKRLCFEVVNEDEDRYSVLFNYLVGEETVEDLVAGTDIPARTMYYYIDKFYLNFNYVRIVV